MTDRTRWGAVFILIFAGVISALQIGKAAIAVPVLQRELVLTLLAASWIVGAYGVIGAVAGLPAGILKLAPQRPHDLDRGAHGCRHRQPRWCIRRERHDPDRDAGAGRLRIARGVAGSAAAAAHGDRAEASRTRCWRCLPRICRSAQW